MDQKTVDEQVYKYEFCRTATPAQIQLQIKKSSESVTYSQSWLKTCIESSNDNTIKVAQSEIDRHKMDAHTMTLEWNAVDVTREIDIHKSNKKRELSDKIATSKQKASAAQEDLKILIQQSNNEVFKWIEKTIDDYKQRISDLNEDLIKRWVVIERIQQERAVGKFIQPGGVAPIRFT
jgi:hypothetical protein